MSDHMFQIPEPWEISKLPEIADINMGQSPSSSDVNEHGEGIVFFQGKAEFGKLYPTPKKYCTKPTKIASAGDILLSVRAPVGPTNLANQSTAIGRGLAAISAYHGLMESRYLLYFFKCIEPWLSTQGTGSTFKAISGQFIRDLQSPVPPLAEQKIIAEKLDTLLAQVDSTKARLEQIPQILKRFRQAVLAAAVNGHLNKTAQSNTKKRTLQEVGIIIKTGPFGSALHKSDYISNGIPVINPMHINDGIISPSLSMTISDEKYAELCSWSLQDGDIIVGRRGEMGRAAVVNIGQSKMLCGTGSMILRTKENIEPRYLELILRSPTAISYFNKEAVGSTMVNLNQKVINSLEAYIPNVEEQREIVRRVEQLFAYADTIEKQVNNALARVNNLTQSILAKAFRGELTAQWRAENPDLISGENSAAALLEKIKAERAASGSKKASRKKS
ncbi:restriction endonuclease subunit S [Escherichia coli]|uniref:restriction endonuclease subunit S n=1 Tax=Escherichia coli TaxID=562 RepID=UPI000BE6B00F|nr:restriction endonuclease subunit S [Escherichia coli]MCN7407817.1 restriction endonuclease subunit S [Escherichia coli]